MDAVVTTLCVVRRSDQVLLGYKKRGFGAGRWNGFGGKVTSGESIAAAAWRELHEEAGLIPLRAASVGSLAFSFANGRAPILVHVFLVTSWQGQPQETDEMRPQWFPTTALPWDTMWPDDRFWLPAVVAGQAVHGVFRFTDEQQLFDHHVNTLALLPTAWHNIEHEASAHLV